MLREGMALAEGGNYMGESVSSSTAYPEGPELLDGLYVVNGYLQDASKKLNQYWELERKFRGEVVPNLIETNTLSDKSQYGLFVAGMAFAGIFGVIGLLGGGVVNFIFCLAIVGVFALGKAKQNKKFLTIGKILIVGLLLVWLRGLIEVFSAIGSNFLGVVFYLVINVGALVAASIGAKKIRDKYNAKQQRDADEANRAIKANNESIIQRRKELAYEVHATVAAMQGETASWYPADYYTIDCCSAFIKYVRNHEADTVKEMVKAYKEDKYREQVITGLSSIKNGVDQCLYNQQKMIALQKVSNLIQMGNLVVNLANNQAINRGADAAARAAYNSGVAAEELKKQNRGFF